MKGFLPVPDSVAFTVFGLDIMWYGVMLSLGTVCGAITVLKRSSRYGFTEDQCYDLFLWGVPAGIIGARLYYVIFEWNYYSQNLREIINTRNGGLAIHGAILGGLGVTALLVWKWKGQPLKLLDMAAPAFAIGQAIGRWGNYFNSEAHGGPTDLPWAILCDGELVHPTFLYESIWCFLLYIFLLWFEKSGKVKYDGQIFIIYSMAYSFERFWVEQLRTDSLYIGSLRQACVLSAAAFAACFILSFPLKKHRGH